MNHLEKTFSDMQNRCIAFLHDNESMWITTPVIKEDVDALEKNKKELDQTVQAQKDSDPGGQVAQKKKEFTTLAKKFYKLGCKLCHFAKKTKNMVLLKSVDIPESGFLRGEEKEVMLKFNTVISAARENLTSLAAYNYKKDDVDALETQYKDLVAIPGTISVLIGNQKSATRSIKELNDEARTILDQLDDVLEGMIEDEKFLESWFEERKIKGRHYPKKDNGKTNGTTPEVS